MYKVIVSLLIGMFLISVSPAIAIETYNVTIFEHGKSTFGSPQKERKGKLIVYNKNEIEFQIKATKIIHKIKLKGPDFQFSSKNGEGRVDIVFEDALISGAVVEKFDGRKMVKSSKKAAENVGVKARTELLHAFIAEIK